MRRLLYTIAFFLYSIHGFSQFTANNIAALQVDASANNTTGSVVEINKTASNQSAITTVAIDGTSANAVRFSGSATSTGYLATTNDGSLLCFTGANSTNTSANVNTLNPRSVGTISASQTFNLATTYTGVSGNQTRGTTSVDNANWFIADQGGLYTNETTTSSPSGNFRSIKAFGGTVYLSSSSSTASVIQVSTISAATGGTLTGLPGLTNNANLQDFYLTSSGTNGSTYDVLYVLSATSNTAGTINKFSLISGSWVANGSYTTTFGGFGLAAETAGTGSNLYVSTGQGALTGNSIIKLNDAAGFNTTIAINSANNISLYTAPAAKIVKGVAFTPVASTSPAINANPATLSFANTTIGAVTAGQSVTLTASNLKPSSGTLTITAPNTNFQVSNNGTTWGTTTTVSYSNTGSTIGSFQVRFSPQSSGTQSGNVAITSGGLFSAVNVAVSGTGTNNLSLTFSASTTQAISPPYVSGVINDVADPAQQQGIIADVKENGVSIAAANYTLTASSSNTSVVPNANIAITKADRQATVKITPAGVGYDDITLTLTSNGNTTPLVIHYAASLPASASAGAHWHTGFGDASGAVALDDTYMVVCNDENNFLYVYRRDQSGLPVKSFNFNQGNILSLTDGVPDYKEVDVEACTPSGATLGKSYWLGSMSNSSSFNNKPNRNRLFAITTTGTGAATSFANAGSYNNLRQQLITWGDANGYNFSASAVDGHDSKVIDGFNLEGMVFGPDNTTLYLGFRAPLVPTANRTNAVIAPILNFETWFNNGVPAGNPTIGAPIELNLGGRGIRDIIKQSNGNYIIVAGSYDGASNPAVYNWTGNAASAPQLVNYSVSGLNLEGALQVNEGGVLSPNKVQFLSDNGDKIYYGDGVASKDLAQDNFKKFSSDVISSSAALPVEFVYFNANRQNNNIVLQWQTGQTNSLRAFEIMRSINGADFITVATIKSLNTQTNYTYTDNNVAGGKIYYRIKAVEMSDWQFYSAVRVLSTQTGGVLISMYPNPVTNNLFTISVNKIGDKNVQIYSGNGLLYKTFHFSEQVRDVNTSLWSKGYYVILVALSDGEVVTKRLLVE